MALVSFVRGTRSEVGNAAPWTAARWCVTLALRCHITIASRPVHWRDVALSRVLVPWAFPAGHGYAGSCSGWIFPPCMALQQQTSLQRTSNASVDRLAATVQSRYSSASMAKLGKPAPTFQPVPLPLMTRAMPPLAIADARASVATTVWAAARL